MKISSKGRYAVRILVEIAWHNDFLSVADISKSQDISIKYVEKIITYLVKAKLIESMRGTKGGYKLSQPAEEITIYQILLATGDTPKISSCSTNKCNRIDICPTANCWANLTNLINDYLKSITLKDLMKPNTKID